MIWLIILLIVLAACVGYATGSLCTLLYGTATALKMAGTLATERQRRLDTATNEWLDNVQARLDDLCECGDKDCVREWRKLAEQDVPALIAEVRRLACRNFDLEQGADAPRQQPDEGDQADDLCCADPANCVECRDGEPGEDRAPVDPFFESTYADPAVRAAISKAGR